MFSSIRISVVFLVGLFMNGLCLAQNALQNEASTRQFIQEITAEASATADRREAFATQIQNINEIFEERLNEISTKPLGEKYQALVEFVIWRLTDLSIYLPASIQQFRWDRVWDSYAAWYSDLTELLIPALREGTSKWYSHHDFQKDLDKFREANHLIEVERADFVDSTMRDLEVSGVFAELRQIAKEYDETLVALKAAAEAGDQDEAQRLHSEAESLFEKMSTTQLDLKSDLLARGKVFREKIDSKLAELSALEMPQMGSIDSASTRPRKVNTTRRPRFVVHFSGENIPRDLLLSDIETPAGLTATQVSGGGRGLNIAFEVTGEIPDGKSLLKIAGMPYEIDFDSNYTPAPDEDPLSPDRDSPFTGPSVEADLPEDGKGTLLYWRALNQLPQSLKGYWQYDKASRESDPKKADSVFSFDFDSLTNTLQLLYAPVEAKEVENLVANARVEITDTPYGVTGQYPQKLDPHTYTGLSLIQEKVEEGEEADCPQYRWWAPASVRFSQNYLSAREDIQGRKHDDETCESTETPDPLQFKYERFVGASFTPFENTGGYIHTVVVGAPFGYEVSVRLSWDYKKLPGKTLKVSYSKDGAQSLPIGNFDSTEPSTYVFKSNQTGQFMFIFQVFDEAGKLIHTDRALALLDR